MKDSSTRQFYRSFTSIVLPIALQQLISAAVGVADTLMMTFVSQTALAASSLAGQIMMVLNMTFGGLAAGITMLTAQYWGKGDKDAVERILAIGLKLSLLIAGIFFIAAVFFPRGLMRIFTDDAGMIEAGAEYLRVVGFSYLFMGLSQPYLSSMKSIEQVRASTVINSVALVLNIVLNAAFIFGWLPGIPPMGIRGVALATVIARAVEFALCILVGEKKRILRLRPRLLFLRSRTLTKDFIRYALPALGNDVAWSLAFSMYSVILGHLGEEIVAANSIVSTMRNLVSVLGFGIANGTAIILGVQIGAGNMARAEKDARRLVWLTFASGVLGGLCILCCHPLVGLFTSLTPLAQNYLHIMIWISSVYVIGPVINTCLICGVFRAGGDSKFGFILDFAEMWGVFVPLGFIAAFPLDLPPMWVYLILSMDEFAKMPIVFIRYRQKKWLKNITKPSEELA